MENIVSVGYLFLIYIFFRGKMERKGVALLAVALTLPNIIFVQLMILDMIYGDPGHYIRAAIGFIYLPISLIFGTAGCVIGIKHFKANFLMKTAVVLGALPLVLLIPYFCIIP